MSKFLITSFLGLTISLSASGVFAKDIAIDVTHCGSGTVHMLERSKDLVIYGLDIQGLSIAKGFPNTTFNCMGWIKLIQGKPSGDGACKFKASSGDYFVGSWKPIDHTKSQFKFIKGTGKFSGISGEAIDTLIEMRGLDSTDSFKQGGKYHRCSHAVGKIILPDPK